jgi:Zn-dependent peptidase ImmA (M78 family)
LLEDRGLILVDSWEVEQWPNRRRFTIAHELGHFILHRRNPDYLASPGATGLPLVEAEAHAFAAALLMPAALLRPAADSCEGDWSQLLKPFLTTNGAVERRLRTLGYEVPEKKS